MKRIIIPALAGLALLMSGCRIHEPDWFYVGKEAQRIVRLNPALVGEWEGKLTDYDSNGNHGKTYDSVLEIRESGTWILRDFGPNKESSGSFNIWNSDRINGSIDASQEGLTVTLGSKDEIILMRSVSKVGDFYEKMHRKN